MTNQKIRGNGNAMHNVRQAELSLVGGHLVVSAEVGHASRYHERSEVASFQLNIREAVQLRAELEQFIRAELEKAKEAQQMLDDLMTNLNLEGK